MSDEKLRKRYFYVEGEHVKIVEITERTANRIFAICHMPRRNSGKIFEAAYYYACSKGEPDLTDETLNEYLDMKFGKARFE